MNVKFLQNQHVRDYINFQRGLLVLVFFLLSALGAQAQTVTSDKDDYAPGELAIISGTGWAGDNSVDIHFTETPAYHGEHEHDYHGIAVDKYGNWTITYQIEDRHLGVAFDVHVIGKQTGREAHTFFTDSNISNLSLGTQTGGTPVKGVSSTVSYPSSIKMAGNGNKKQTPVKLTYTNLPTGVTASPDFLYIDGNIDSYKFDIYLTTSVNTPVLASPGHSIGVAATTDPGSTLNGTIRLIVNDAAKTNPVITWSNPSDITYGTALGNTQLNATADVAGTFTYTPAAGTVLNASEGQTLSVTFTPTNTTNYNTVTKTVSINVEKAKLAYKATPVSRAYGEVNPFFNGTIIGFVNGETQATATTGTLSFASTATQSSNVGSYAISGVYDTPCL